MEHLTSAFCGGAGLPVENLFLSLVKFPSGEMHLIIATSGPGFPKDPLCGVYPIDITKENMKKLGVVAVLPVSFERKAGIPLKDLKDFLRVAVEICNTSEN